MATASLEQLLGDHAIVLPPNVWTSAMLSFARDEMISGVGNTLANGIVGEMYRGQCSDAKLALVGLVLEKPWLLSWSVGKTAVTAYRTPRSERKSFRQYARMAWEGGKPSLIKDVCVHDPFDWLFMLAGYALLPGVVPTAVISAGSFAASVVVAGALEIRYKERKYNNLKKTLAGAGFGQEDYFEARFLIPSDEDPQRVLAGMREEFSLGDYGDWQYHDTYVPHTLPDHNGRLAKVRLRERTSGDATARSVEVVHTLTKENRERHWPLCRPKPGQFNYYVARKEKSCYALSDASENQDPMPATPGQIPDRRVRDIMLGLTQQEMPLDQVHFRRQFVHDPELLVSVDQVQGERPFYLAELKVRSDLELMRHAMYFMMRHYRPLQTTHGKHALVHMAAQAK